MFVVREDIAMHRSFISVVVVGYSLDNYYSTPYTPRARVAQLVRYLNNLTLTSLSPIRRGFAPGFVNYKKGALDSQPPVIKFTSCLPIVGGSLRVLRLLLPQKLVAMI